MSDHIPPYVLLESYARGIFPMSIDGEIGWFSPQQRGILPLHPPSFSHGVRREWKKRAWDIRLDTAFRETVLSCANRRETWIDDTILESFEKLFELGFAHSVEVWEDGRLVGGLYGLHIGAAFFGESMFHTLPGASKVALSALMLALSQNGFELLDTQWITPHLLQFGAVEIPKPEYLRMLAKAIPREVPFPARLPSPAR